MRSIVVVVVEGAAIAVGVVAVAASGAYVGEGEVAEHGSSLSGGDSVRARAAFRVGEESGLADEGLLTPSGS